MCCENFWKKITAFTLAFTIGLLAGKIFIEKESAEKKQENVEISTKIVAADYGRGSAVCYGSNNNDNFGSVNPSEKVTPLNSSVKTNNLKIISKPAALYTPLARQNRIEGKVTLRVTFLANGEIGNIYPVLELPDGLTEQAIEAANKIKFQPLTENGQPKSVVKTVQYTFSIL